MSEVDHAEQNAGKISDVVRERMDIPLCPPGWVKLPPEMREIVKKVIAVMAATERVEGWEAEILCSEEYAALSPEKREIVDREIARLAAK